MEPISALIGAGASLLGGFMNTSSQQAINTASLQTQQWMNNQELAFANKQFDWTKGVTAQQQQNQQFMETGANMPAVAANIKAAAAALGVNPVALAGNIGGSTAPVAVGAVPGPNLSAPRLENTMPGAGLQDAAKFLANMKDPHTVRMENIAERKGEAEIQSANAGISNTMIEMAKNQFILDYLRSHPSMHPADVAEPTLAGSGADWLNNLNRSISGLGASISKWRPWQLTIPANPENFSNAP